MRYVIVIFILFFLTCHKAQKIYKAKHTFYRMDTVVEVTVVRRRNTDGSDTRSEVLRKLQQGFAQKKNLPPINVTWEKVDSLLTDYEVRFSQIHPESEVLFVNSRKNIKKRLSPILVEMLSTGLRYGDTLAGMFDLTILPIKELWGFSEDEQKEVVPEPDTVRKTLERVDYRNVCVDSEKQTVTFNNPDVVIDVGGIAKGYSLRAMAVLLDTLGYDDYLVVAGGDIISRGERPDGKPWRVGIKHPRKSQELLGAFNLDSGSVVTSGDYERYWVQDGKRYHHIFNPHTGYCCTGNQSLTIWCMDPIIADVLSTGLFCFPKDSVLSFVEQRPFLECVVVDSSGDVFISKGWEDKVEIF